MTPCFPILITLISAIYAFAEPITREFPVPVNPGEFHEQELARIVSRLQAVSSPLTETQQDFDVVYYELDLDIRNFSGETIYGTVTTVARALISNFNELSLDLCDDLTVDSVYSGGNSVSFTHTNDLLTITLDRDYAADELVTVTVFYYGTPCETSNFTSFDFWNRPVSGDSVPTIATLSEPYGARDWWPAKDTPDDKADSARISITVADTVTATSNGTLESVTAVNPSSLKYTWFENHPIATYLISIAATNYVSFQDWYVSQSGDSMPVDYYSFPEKLSQAEESWSITPDALDFLAGLFGEYPFVDEKYGHTMFGIINGAMEHQCNTSYAHGLANGLHNYDFIVVHEAAHQWWGDDVTLASWPDIWLNEGFATFCEALWREHINGFEDYKNYMTSFTGARVIDPSGPVYNPANLFSGNSVYHKGAWILHMLRGIVRDDSLFFAALREYRARHSGGNATTAEFLSDMSDVLNFDVSSYLYVYLYLTNRPHFQVSFGSGTVDGNLRTAVRIRQTQTNPDTVFHTRLDLKFTGGMDTTVRVENFSESQDYFFDFAVAPAALNLDPDEWVLKQKASESLAPVILNASLSAGEQSQSYADTLIAIGGTAPYQWLVLNGTLPSGLTLSSSGVLSGAPTIAGDFPVTIRVTDNLSITDTAAFLIHISAPLTAPQELTITTDASGNIILNWQSVAAADSYDIYRATLSDFSDGIVIGSTTTTTFTDSPAAASDAIRFYRIHAVKD